MKLKIYILFLSSIMCSCKTTSVKYPIFYYWGQHLEQENTMLIDEYEFKETFTNNMLKQLFFVVDSCASEYLFFDFSAHCDTIYFTFQNTDINTQKNLYEKGILGIVKHRPQNKLKQEKKLFFICNMDNMFFVQKTNRRYKFTPFYVQLPYDKSIVTYDWITTFDGWITEDTLHTNKCIINK